MASVKALLRDPVLRGLLLLAVVLTLWSSVGAGTVSLRVSLYWLVQVGLDVTFVIFGWRVIRLTADRPAVRRFWCWVVAGACFFIAADSLQSVTALARPGYPSAIGSTYQSLLVVTGVACVVAGTLRFPVPTKPRERARWWLDAATIEVGVASFVWAYWASRPGDADAARLGVLVVGSGFMLVCAFGLIRLLLSGNAPFTRAAGIAGGLSATLVAVANAFAPAPHGPVTLNVLIALHWVPLVLLTATPRIQEVQLRADPDVLIRRRPRPYARLPYLAVAAVQVLLVVVLIKDGMGVRAWGVVAGAILSTALVVVRQLAAFADNSRLLARLHESQLTAQRQEERFRSLVQHASDITLVIDPDGRVTYASPATDPMLGVPPEEVTGEFPQAWVHPDDWPTFTWLAREVCETPHTTVTAQLRVRHADGSWRWAEAICIALLDDPSVGGIICNLRDVTEARQLKERLQHAATHDPLTQLANRSLFDERIRVDEGAGARRDEPVAILTVDLDDFKAVNDRLGHHVGDALLAGFAERLVTCVRPTDVVARMGGDEFAILLRGASMTDAAAVAQRIQATMERPVTVHGRDLFSRASIGIALGRRDEAMDLVRASDMAMYSAKQKGKGRIAVATPPDRSR